ncbi:MAG: DUF3105 domain-containing protein, partial [Kofleriaceae bacterium]
MRAWLAIVFVAAGCERLAGLHDLHGVQPQADAELDAEVDADVPTCNGMLDMPANEGAMHTTNDGDLVSYNANPPASGTHYPDWAKWGRTYATEIPRGYWIHNLEHAGVVFLYNCTDCQDEIDRVTAVMNAIADDSMCSGSPRVRALVTPDAMLPTDVRWAALSWNHRYVASCLNVPELTTFAGMDRFSAPEPEQ